jgi:hypothetical protein
MERLSQAFLATNPKYLDGAKIGIELVVLDNLAAADRIASGALKIPMWLAPDKAFAEVVAAKAVNLGAKPAECVPLFQTSLGLVGKRSDIRALQAGEQEIDLAMAIKNVAEGTRADPLSTPLFLIPSASDAWVGRIFLASFSRFRKAAGPELTGRLRNLLLDPAESEASIFERVAAFHGSNPLLGFVSEQSARLLAGPALSFSKIAQAGVVSRYSLCTSVAPWVTEGERLAADRFKAFLRDSVPREIASQFGFDPPATSDSTVPLQSEELTSLHALVASERKVPALMVVVDLSGSLTGDPCLSVKTAVSSFLESFARESSRYHAAAVVFNTGIERAVGFSSSVSDAVQAINSIDCRGGSGVYPAIMKGIEEFAEARSTFDNQVSRHIMIISDGYGSVLPGEEESFVNRASRLLIKHRVSAHFFGVTHTAGDLKSLPSRLQSVGAATTVLPLDQLGSRLETYRRSLTWSLESPQ